VLYFQISIPVQPGNLGAVSCRRSFVCHQRSPVRAGNSSRVREAVSASAGAQVLIGLAAGLLGILALVGFGPAILTLVALLCIGSAVVMNGTAISGRILSLVT
jgi:hypothetical protein